MAKAKKKSGAKRGGVKKSSAELDFATAFKYPFNRWKGMLNILWVLLPIFGWFALGGYGVRIVKEFSQGKFKQLPLFSFVSDMKLGAFMFVKALPFMIAYVIVSSILDHVPVLGSAASLVLELFVVPILSINFMIKQSIESYFEFDILKSVTENLGEYFMTLLKSIGLFLVFAVMILVIVGLPAMAFTTNIFFADFYRRRIMKKKEDG